jgi:Protein phosphatase 2C
VADTTITLAALETTSAVGFFFEAAGASVRGAAHEATGQPCQDCFAIKVCKDWVVAVVSDGAGSADRAADGARIVSHEICGALSGFLNDSSGSDVLGADLCSRVKGVLIGGIERARQHCLDEAHAGETLRSFHATLVGTVLGNTGGVLFHLGDGGGSAHRRTTAGLETICFSEPENGEYINETFFFTQERWREHLRLTTISGPVDAVWLMTDGAYELMVPPRQRQLREVTEQEIDRLVFEEGDGSKSDVISAILSSPQATARNDDDKTLVIVRRTG